MIDNFTLNIKSWKKVYDNWMDVLRSWVSNNHDKLLEDINLTIFKEDWDKYAEGNLSSWEMFSLGFYYHEHELMNINTSRYGISDFNSFLLFFGNSLIV